MSQVAAEMEELTLPQVAVELGLSLDFVRKQFTRVPELSAHARRIGRMRIVRVRDLPEIREVFAKLKSSTAP